MWFLLHHRYKILDFGFYILCLLPSWYSFCDIDSVRDFIVTIFLYFFLAFVGNILQYWLPIHKSSWILPIVLAWYRVYDMQFTFHTGCHLLNRIPFYNFSLCSVIFQWVRIRSNLTVFTNTHSTFYSVSILLGRTPWTIAKSIHLNCKEGLLHLHTH